MLSNKLTFSLVFVLVLVFAATSVYAQVVPEDSEPAKGKFAVVARTAGGTDTNPFGDANGIGVLDPVVPATTELGDLDGILLQGGSIELALNAPTTDTDDATVTVKSTLDADDIAALELKHKVVISEIMWGENLTPSADDAEAEAQWIEIYNHGLDLGDGDTLTLIYSLIKQSSADVGKKVPRTVGNTEGQCMSSLTKLAHQVVLVLGLPKAAVVILQGLTVVISQTPTPFRPRLLFPCIGTLPLKMLHIRLLPTVLTKGKLEGLGDGNEAASWTESVGSVNMRGYYVGSPGSVHVTPAGTAVSFRCKILLPLQQTQVLSSTRFATIPLKAKP